MFQVALHRFGISWFGFMSQVTWFISEMCPRPEGVRTFYTEYCICRTQSIWNFIRYLSVLLIIWMEKPPVKRFWRKMRIVLVLLTRTTIPSWLRYKMNVYRLQSGTSITRFDRYKKWSNVCVVNNLCVCVCFAMQAMPSHYDMVCFSRNYIS